MSLPNVLKRSCLPLLGAGVLFACSSEDSGTPENGRDGTGGAISTDATGESGGTNGSTGGLVGSAGATSGGGVETGSGGTATGGVDTTGGVGNTTGGVGNTTGGVGNTTGGVSNTTGGVGNTTGGVSNTTGGVSNTTGGVGNTTGGVGNTTGGVGNTTGGVDTSGGGAETGGTSASGSTGGTVVTNYELPPPNDFTEDRVPGASFDMVYIPGGTFTLGCESEPCPANTAPVEGVTVSSYHIAKSEMTAELYNTVMGGESSGFGGPSINWYNAMEFACELSRQTGRAYRMMTEAEFEYAAKNHLDSLEDVGSGEEWAYNTWSASHMGGTDPVGPGSGVHTQKTRRDAQNTGDNITGRLIRSIEGIGPQLRLVLSAETTFPPEYVPPCDLHAPEMGDEPANSYRDPRWITGSDAHWTSNSEWGGFDLRVWEDGTASMVNMMGGTTEGQWFTSNNIAFVFVQTSGELTKYPYIFLDSAQGSVLSSSGFANGGYIGRIQLEEAEAVDKPAISDLKSGAELAAAAGDEYKMVDMENIPDSAKEQDARLIDGPGVGWSQKNVGSQHHYRKDVDADEFRFTVNQSGSRVMLANGEWFTVGKTFLRITHSDGYTCDYLYAVSEDGSTFYHDSFQGYERGDFRMFTQAENGPDFNDLCGEICNDEIPKGEPASFYSTQDIGQSTYVPAPCPEGGCE